MAIGQKVIQYTPHHYIIIFWGGALPWLGFRSIIHNQKTSTLQAKALFVVLLVLLGGQRTRTDSACQEHQHGLVHRAVGLGATDVIGRFS